MSTLKTSFQDNASGVIASAVSWLGVVTASQEQLEFWLKCVSYLGAILVSYITLYRMLRAKK
jgi:tagatose-1,6-bisphosphate aldolase